MPYFINLRSHPVGGWLDKSQDPKIQLSPPATKEGFNTQVASRAQFLADVRGQNVLVATHGFNDSFVFAVGALTNWATLLNLPGPSTFIGVLWPGDSIWAHGLDYPLEPKVADESGALLGPFLDEVLSDAATISFASHSLGARVVLQTITHMSRRIKHVTLMAGAIDDTCLTGEFQKTTANVENVSVLASTRDEVLALAFPLGNLVGGILDKGHPWWHTALGRDGPAKPFATQFQPPFQIPTNWAYGHHDYLQTNPGYVGADLTAGYVPTDGSAYPALDAQGNPVPGWQQAWSAAFVRNRFS
jgi:Alpha/beta hydrolase of unknown function (DUF900)